MPEPPAWLTRWQQRVDDELLYVDQTRLLPHGLTFEEQVRVSRQQDEADPEEDVVIWRMVNGRRQVLDEYEEWHADD